MSEDTSAPVGQAQEPVANETGKTNKNDSVAYETHRKLLGEKKSLQERNLELEQKLNEFQQSVEAKQQKELEEQQRFQELYEQAKSENQRLSETLTQRDQQMQDALKIDAFNTSLGDRTIDRKYFGFIDTKNILIDPTTGNVDELSAQKEVERVLAEFPEIVRSKSAAKPLPTQAPQGVSSVKKPTMQERFEFLAKQLEANRKRG